MLLVVALVLFLLFAGLGFVSHLLASPLDIRRCIVCRISTADRKPCGSGPICPGHGPCGTDHRVAIIAATSGPG